MLAMAKMSRREHLIVENTWAKPQAGSGVKTEATTRLSQSLPTCFTFGQYV